MTGSEGELEAKCAISITGPEESGGVEVINGNDEPDRGRRSACPGLRR
jgi:hypothetical protein